MTDTYPPKEPIWCAGCGHFGVQAALADVMRSMTIPPEEVLILAGIGCSGTIQNNLGTYGYHALHGRVLPTATGAALADPGLTVIAAGGDGDGYAIGVGHLVHTMRRNPNLVYLLMNNITYGLTKGQVSPTAPPDETAGSLDGILLGLSIPSSSFLARGFVRHPEQLRRLFHLALEHARGGAGFGFVEVLSPCVTYQDTYPLWDSMVVDLDEDPAHDPGDRAGTFASCLGHAEAGRIPIGLILEEARQAPAAGPAPAHAAIEGLGAEYQRIAGEYVIEGGSAGPAD